MKISVLFTFFWKLLRQTPMEYIQNDSNEPNNANLNEIYRDGYHSFQGNCMFGQAYLVQNPNFSQTRLLNLNINSNYSPDRSFYHHNVAPRFFEDPNIPFSSLFYENHQGNLLTTNPRPHQSTNMDFTSRYIQHSSTYPSNLDEFQGRNIFYTPENISHGENSDQDILQNNNSCLLTEKKFFQRQTEEEILYKLYNMWLIYGERELLDKYLELYNYFRALKDVVSWNLLDENSEIFHSDMDSNIEFHITDAFENVTFYRKKHFQKSREIKYDYLVAKGEPEKYLKNFAWKGNKIFIMDCSKIGKNVTLHGYTYIGPSCEIGENCCILNNCFLKKNVKIEKDTFINRNNYFGEGCKIGILNEKYDVLHNENENSLENNSSKIKGEEKLKFITRICSYNFFGDNFVLPNEYSVCSGNVYI